MKDSNGSCQTLFFVCTNDNQRVSNNYTLEIGIATLVSNQRCVLTAYTLLEKSPHRESYVLRSGKWLHDTRSHPPFLIREAKVTPSLALPKLPTTHPSSELQNPVVCLYEVFLQKHEGVISLTLSRFSSLFSKNLFTVFLTNSFVQYLTIES
jgi:hypothetical protein